ncbi:MAG: phage tail protein [Betaproteobacteria bacterium]|nr:phage tail protein [Betaproteobacteria bacterium]
MEYYTSDNPRNLKAGEYPPPAFYFKVTFSGFGDYSDTSFQEVSGISRKMETEEYSEGGENRFVHHLPKPVKYENLVLKRGIATKKSELIKWCRAVLEGGLTQPIQTRRILVLLMNATQVPIRAWQFTNAYPVKWAVDGFNSTKNEVSIETIELSYNEFSRVEP